MFKALLNHTENLGQPEIKKKKKKHICGDMYATCMCIDKDRALCFNNLVW